jgi:hypothetical protein
MKRVIAEIGVLGTLLAIVGVALHVGHDRATLVPPPESVVENFVRGLAAGRYEPARQRLAEDLKVTVHESDLRAVEQCLIPEHAPVAQVEGRRGFHDRENAQSVATLTFLDGSKRDVVFGLRWDQGKWGIARLPECGDTSSSPAT